MLPTPRSLAGIPTWYYKGAPCIIGFEDDPDSDQPTAHWRLVARRLDTPMPDVVAVLSTSVSTIDQVKLLGRYLGPEEIVLNTAVGTPGTIDWVSSGLLIPTNEFVSLADGRYPVMQGYPSDIQVHGVRIPSR